jgi:hypothetical protein
MWPKDSAVSNLEVGRARTKNLVRRYAEQQNNRPFTEWKLSSLFPDHPLHFGQRHALRFKLLQLL